MDAQWRTSSWLRAGAKSGSRGLRYTAADESLFVPQKRIAGARACLPVSGRGDRRPRRDLGVFLAADLRRILQAESTQLFFAADPQ